MTAADGRPVVIHYYYSWLPQTQTWMYTQLVFTPAELVDSHVVCDNTENLDQFGVPNIHSLSGAGRPRYLWDKGLRRLGVRHYIGFLAEQARRLDAAVIHSHFGNVGWENLGAARRSGTRHVVTFYGRDVNMLPVSEPVWRRRYRELFGAADYILCEGSHMAAAIVALGCPAEKVRVHHLGVRIDQIRYAPRTWTPGTPLKVLIAAAFREKKGIPYAIEALARLRKRIELEVTIIGDATAEAACREEKRRILSAIERGGLHGSVYLLGYQPYSVFFDEAYRHHIFLSPSVTAADGDTEGGAPVSLIEMAATGMPIVSTEHCDIPEVVIQGETGLLAKERDVEGLVGHLAKLVDDPGSWQPMLAAGRRHVEQEYDVRVQGQRLAEIYRSLAGVR
ncbi:MAG: glycosyltransferase [Thermoleophilia bacterium]